MYRVFHKKPFGFFNRLSKSFCWSSVKCCYWYLINLFNSTFEYLGYNILCNSLVQVRMFYGSNTSSTYAFVKYSLGVILSAFKNLNSPVEPNLYLFFKHFLMQIWYWIWLQTYLFNIFFKSKLYWIYFSCTECSIKTLRIFQ